MDGWVLSLAVRAVDAPTDRIDCWFDYIYDGSGFMRSEI